MFTRPTKHADWLTTKWLNRLNETFHTFARELLVVHKAVVSHTQHINALEIFECVFLVVFHIVYLQLTEYKLHYFSMAKEDQNKTLGRRLHCRVINTFIRLYVDPLDMLLDRTNQIIIWSVTHHILQNRNRVAVFNTAISSEQIEA